MERGGGREMIEIQFAFTEIEYSKFSESKIGINCVDLCWRAYGIKLRVFSIGECVALLVLGWQKATRSERKTTSEHFCFYHGHFFN